MDTSAIVLLAAIIVGLGKGGVLGPAAGSLVVPLLSQAMPVSTAVGLALPLLMIGDFAAMPAYWRKWDARLVWLMLPAALIGIIIGTLLLASLSDIVLRRLLGVFTLVIVAYRLLSERLRNVAYVPRDWHGGLAGALAGFGSALANAGGPPLAAYLLLQNLQPVAFVGTVTLFFFTVNLLKIPGYLGADVINVDLLGGLLWALPIVPAALLVGRWIVFRLDKRLFDWIVLLSLIAAGVYLLFGTPPT